MIVGLAAGVAEGGGEAGYLFLVGVAAMLGVYDLGGEVPDLRGLVGDVLVLLGYAFGAFLGQSDVHLEALLLVGDLEVEPLDLGLVGVVLGQVGAGVVFAPAGGYEPVEHDVADEAEAEQGDDEVLPVHDAESFAPPHEPYHRHAQTGADQQRHRAGAGQRLEALPAAQGPLHGHGDGDADGVDGSLAHSVAEQFRAVAVMVFRHAHRVAEADDCHRVADIDRVDAQLRAVERVGVVDGTLHRHVHLAGAGAQKKQGAQCDHRGYSTVIHICSLRFICASHSIG